MSRPSWSCNARPRRTLLWPKRLVMKPCEFGPTGVWPAIKLAQSDDAVANWQEALDEDSKGRPLKSQPSVLYVLPYLARGYYLLGRYESGLKAATEWAETTSDHASLQADAYCWPQIAMQSWVVTQKPAGTRTYLGRHDLA